MTKHFNQLDSGCATVKDMPLFDHIPDTRKMVTAFEKYDSENPEIWNEFRDITLKLIRMGKEHYGSKAIFEAMRFERAVKGNDDFKLNNNYTADYARKFIKAFPMYKEFFELREKQI